MANDRKEERGDKGERPQREPPRQLGGPRRGGPPPQSPWGGIWRQYKMPIIIAGVFLLILVLVIPSLSGPAEEETESPQSTQDQFSTPVSTEAGTRVTIQSRRHISEGTTAAQAGEPYNTVPPTSGVHWADPAPWGCHDQPIPHERQVHNLEHGGIMVQYDPTAPDPELVDRLKELVGRYENRVILAPHPQLLLQTNAAIALTAWGWINTLNTFDKNQITRFIDAHIGKGPESTTAPSAVLPCS